MSVKDRSLALAQAFLSPSFQVPLTGPAACRRCIRNLLAGNAEIQAEASRRGFVPILVSLMRDGSQRIREYAIGAGGGAQFNPHRRAPPPFQTP